MKANDYFYAEESASESLTNYICIINFKVDSEYCKFITSNSKIHRKVINES